jgi:hypothetical protein
MEYSPDLVQGGILNKSGCIKCLKQNPDRSRYRSGFDKEWKSEINYFWD